MSPLEISILILAALILLSANTIASMRVMRRLGRYGMGYVFFIWLVPVIGAMYVLAKIKRERPARLLPINANTISSATTIQADPWPTVQGMTGSHHHFRK